MKITRLDIRNYRGISELHEDVAASGAVISGANGKGKTSVLNALRAAFAGQDIGEDAIRIGADKAEILVDLDNMSVRRVISARGSSLDVTRDGMRAQKPQAFLSHLLGSSAFDPLDLLLAKPKERRARVLEALPITVTLEQLRRWAPDADVDTSGHGLEVIGRVRSAYYERRTAANKAATAAAEDQRRLEDAALHFASRTHTNAPALDEARAALTSANAELARLEAARAAAERADAKGASSRARIDALTAEASDLRAQATRVQPADAELADAGLRVSAAKGRVADLEGELAAAKAVMCGAHDALAALEASALEAKRLVAHAGTREGLAGDLRSTLAAVTAEAPDAVTLDAAATAVATASEAVDAATAAAAYREAQGKATAAEARAVAAAFEASRLDAIVKALTNDAPAELLSSGPEIPGLSLEGEDVMLDGIRLDALCGSEQIRFCVDIARRLNSKSRILMVDGLERLDPDQRESFVQFATADGYQLLGTLVDRGEPVFGAIRSDVTEAAE